MPKSSRRRVAMAAAGVAVLAAVIVVGLVLGARQDPPEVVAVDGPPVAAIAGPDPISGEQVSVEDFRGRPLVINAWASWCAPCRTEAPDIRRFTETHPEVAFLGVDVSDTAGGARAFVREFGWTHPSISDPSGRLSARLGVTGLPTTLFVRPSGNIAAEIPGEVTYEQLVEAAALLGSPR